MRILKRYSNGAVEASFEGTDFTISRDGGIGWMSDWGPALDWKKRGVFTSKHGGPATYGHVTYFIGECYAHVLLTDNQLANELRQAPPEANNLRGSLMAELERRGL